MAKTIVRKAIIAAAGSGTRFLPQTKAMPKEMLPIIDKPVIQMVVEEVVAAGVTDVIIVTGPTKRAIEDHFDQALELEAELQAKGKFEEANALKAISELANFVYVRQKGLPKGNARPVINAAHLIGDEPFFVFFGDDFFSGPIPRAKQLLDVYRETGKSVVSLMLGDESMTNIYGIAEISEKLDEKTFRIKRLVEKPGPAAAPSMYASVGGYLLTPDILPLILNQKVADDGEIRLIDSINNLAQIDEVYGRFIEGTYHDTGSPDLYIQTLIDVALADAQLGEGLRLYLEKKLK